MTDDWLDDTVMTRRGALECARDKLGSVVWYCLDLGHHPDKMDEERIREALEMVEMALQHEGETSPDARDSNPAVKARIAAEDARIMLASNLRAMMNPDRIAVSVRTEIMQQIIDALERE